MTEVFNYSITSHGPPHIHFTELEGGVQIDTLYTPNGRASSPLGFLAQLVDSFDGTPDQYETAVTYDSGHGMCVVVAATQEETEVEAMHRRVVDAVIRGQTFTMDDDINMGGKGVPA